MSGATSNVPYMGTLAIFLIFLGPAFAVTGFDCSGKAKNITTVAFADLMLTGNKLEMTKTYAHQYPKDFAYIFMNLPGYMAVAEDDKFHIMECTAVTVVPQPQNECYDQLPILQDNQKRFFDPWTLIITDKAKAISCDSKILGKYQMEGKTYKVMPKPAHSLVPGNLKSKVKLTWQWKDLNNLMNSGIYTESQINQAWQYHLHPQRFNPPPSIVYVYPDANGNVPGVEYLNPGKFKWYQDLELEHIIAIIVAGIIVITMLVCLVKMLVDRIRHGSALHSIHQCRRRRQARADQSDLTIGLNKPPNT